MLRHRTNIIFNIEPSVAISVQEKNNTKPTDMLKYYGF